MAKTILTGLKPTGSPQLGNYFGMIRPTIEMANDGDYDSYVFIADVHALNARKDPKFIREKSYEVAATYLAAGINPERTVFYRQSDVPEVLELAMLLMNFTPKGLMNRAHAYKAIVDRDGNDENVNMGLYTYPILMAADILIMDADLVPVGLDQKQHIEIARDIANAFNSVYARAVLKMPEPAIRKEVEYIPGLDGRKMSKSYDNGIEIFLSEKDTAAKVMKIPTDSKSPADPKDKESLIYTFMKLFDMDNSFRAAFLKGGVGYGEAKKALAEAMNAYLCPMRERYAALKSDTAALDRILAAGAARARATAARVLSRVREAIGL